MGPVEAYAGRLCKRTITILDSDVVLTLFVKDPSEVPDALRGIRDGDRITAPEFEAIVPGLYRSPFRNETATDPQPFYRLTTIADGIMFTIMRNRQPDAAAAEARVRKRARDCS